MTTANPWEREFRRLLAREAGSGADAPAVAAAAGRLWERLAQQGSRLIGAGGVAAVGARALHLAQRRFPWLASVRTSGHGDESWSSLQQAMAQQEPSVAVEAAIAVFATVGDLLASFIGESLTRGLLRQAWPDDFAGETSQRRPSHD